MFLSADEVMINFESWEMSIDRTGSYRTRPRSGQYSVDLISWTTRVARTLCPYKLKKNLRESWKNTLTVESSRLTAKSLLSGLYLTAKTSSVIFNVLVCTSDSCFVLICRWERDRMSPPTNARDGEASTYHSLLAQPRQDLAPLTSDLPRANIPEFDVLVSATCDEPALVRPNVDSPDRSRMRLNGLQEGRRR